MGITAGLLVMGGCTASTAPSGPGGLPQPSSTEELTGQAVVLEKDGEEPKVCFGLIEASLPPQCGGPAVTGWDWATAKESESAAGVTWGIYAVTGIYDGGGFTVTQPPIPVSRDDPYARQDPRVDGEAGTSSAAELERYQEEMASYFPSGVPDWSEITLLGSGVYNGYLVIDVIYDDGSVQRFFDEQWGEGTTIVQSALWKAT
ncbi:hypothetical protein CTB96_01330 [Cryobacterium arcticum]|uniref:Uncharacterized protein n=1 Tax=Cryobacterium arcticum TaxID=670052 RepID=A0A318A1T3_9MICO|nr:hypothetical protein CTB96_01330 [Cryobacterium arcticum]